jgi:hypothetical protein
MHCSSGFRGIPRLVWDYEMLCVIYESLPLGSAMSFMKLVELFSFRLTSVIFSTFQLVYIYESNFVQIL